MKEFNSDNVDPVHKALIYLALEATDRAYAPYSGFHVGAIVEGWSPDNKGRIISGANVENASYGLAICAERTAILRANMEGFRKITRVVIGTRFADGRPTDSVSGPCGACRQFISEFANLYDVDTEIVTSTTNLDKIVVTSISELLPLSFGPKKLGVNIKGYL